MTPEYLKHLSGLCSFVESVQAKRFKRLLENPTEKNRQKITSTFWHDLKLRAECSTLLEGADGFPKPTYEILKSLGAREYCFVLSRSVEPEAAKQTLFDAVDSIIGNEPGTVISLIPGKFVFWESDDFNMRYILRRSQ